MRKTWKHFTEEEIASWPVEHKKCRTCQEVLPFNKFGNNKRCLFGLDTSCKQCRKPKSKTDTALRTFEQTMLSSSKFRAKQRGIPHTITIEDIVIPEICPILGVQIVQERGHPYAPSLDQITPKGGYTPDNIVVVSRRANIVKGNITYSEAKRLTEWMEENSTEWYVDRHLVKMVRPDHQ